MIHPLSSVLHHVTDPEPPLSTGVVTRGNGDVQTCSGESRAAEGQPAGRPSLCSALSIVSLGCGLLVYGRPYCPASERKKVLSYFFPLFI